MPKVFCIGFNKTGTTTLHQTFIRMGMRSLHGDFIPRQPVSPGNATPYPDPKLQLRRKFEIWRSGASWTTGNIGCLDSFYDCFTDGECHNFRLLHKLYPSAKFILNTRALDRWIVSRLGHIAKARKRPNRLMRHDPSCASHWSRWIPRRMGFAGPPDREVVVRRPEQACRRYMAPCLYDASDSAIAFWIERRRRYHQDVLEYFSGHPDQLLVVNVGAGPTYLDELTSFLGVPGGAAPTIHSGKSKMTDSRRGKLLARAHRVLGNLDVHQSDFASPLLP